jgi:hypothetical protein
MSQKYRSRKGGAKQLATSKSLRHEVPAPVPTFIDDHQKPTPSNVIANPVAPAAIATDSKHPKRDSDDEDTFYYDEIDIGVCALCGACGQRPLQRTSISIHGSTAAATRCAACVTCNRHLSDVCALPIYCVICVMYMLCV